MNLYRAIGSIGGMTMVSRLLGFVRDMLSSRMLGASHANDVFFFAFQLPNIFRKLFGEGAFSSGFVPLFSRRLASGGHEDAQQFSNEILSVFMPTLLLVTLIFEILMPGILWLWIGRNYADVPGKFELAVELTRWTFPYMLFISLVALLSGILNSLTRFAIAAFVPALLNLAMIVALLVTPADELVKVRAMSIAVLIGGILQFALCWVAVKRAGVRLRFGRPRITPAVRELIVLVLPATAAAGVYQISQIFYLYFSTMLGEGALTNLNYADRLNQLPLSIIGTALGVAILPALSQAVERRDEASAADVQARAFDLSMLLALPAALALMVAAGPIIAVIFHGGEYTVEDAITTGNILAILASGLPAYVLMKVLQPAFYARKDVRTPVIISMTILLLNIPANFLLIPHLGIYSLPTVMSVSSWINFLLLFGILYARGQFRMPPWLVGRLSKQLVAALLMGGALFALRAVFEDWFFGETLQKIASLGILVGTGMIIYFGVAWLIGGVDKEAIASLRRRKAAQ